MDDFACIKEEREISPTIRIRKKQIYLANVCQLYLKVTWLSEIPNWDGTGITGWAYHGTRQNGSSITYPHQPKPPEIA